MVNWLNGPIVALARHRPDQAIMERVFNTVTFSCTDPRDQIIALIGMASDVGAEDAEIRLDYSVPESTTFRRFTSPKFVDCPSGPPWWKTRPCHYRRRRVC
jgi:hypothetical protein